MTLNPFPCPLPGMKMWLSHDTERSYCVTYDELSPRSGYVASWWKGLDGAEPENYLPSPFKTLEQASKALAQIQRKSAH